MKDKIKLLQLAPRFPFPEDDGGKIGISACLKEFSRAGFDVDFVVFSDEKIPKVLIDECQKYCKLYIIEHSTYNSISRITLSIFKSKSLYFEKHINDNVKKQLRKIIGDTHYDIIHADHSAMGTLAVYAKEITGAPIGLRLHNVEWKIWDRYAKNLHNYSPKGIYLTKQAELVKNDEKQLFEQVDIAFPITEIDKKAVEEMCIDIPLITATAGVDLDKLSIDSSIERAPNEIIIATTYNWVHNIDGIRWFIDEVMPSIRKEIPEAKLTLIGKNPPDEFKKISEQGVNCLGYVPEIQPFLNRASIYIAPLFAGSGIRIKILEAMAMELPVIATSVSAEGILHPYENGLYISDLAEDWVNSIVSLIQNPKTTRQIGKTAREFISKEYTYEKNIGIIISKYRKLITEG